MEYKLTADELSALVTRVFEPGQSDERLGVIVDMPDQNTPDNPAWKARREMAAEWVRLLGTKVSECGLKDVSLILYRNPKANNADLPSAAFFYTSQDLPKTADDLAGGETSFEAIFKSHRILIAPTEFSATAPLKVAAKKYGFRAATMPGFNRSMIPALKIDYSVVGRRVDRFKKLLDKAESCLIEFHAEGEEYTLNLDLRHRTAHDSSGIFKVGGIAGNLPSGESYIVPYEGEIKGDPSRSSGEIPVQLGEDVVVYRILENRAVEVVSTNEESSKEAHRLQKEPAYGNLAELGLGVLGDFGLEPTGEILLDEKLGLHIAFGRSEHFGGQVGPSSFTSPENVVHIDRVYIPKIQPKVSIARAILGFQGGREVLLMNNGEYQVEME